jgi:lipase chaperone LimK
MNKKLIVISFAAAGLIWAGFELIQGSKPDDMQQAAAEQAGFATPVGPATMVRPADVLKRADRPTHEQLRAGYEQFMANRPPYLANIDLPGRYAVDENGNLIMDAGVKEMLDFFMLAIGDLSFEQIHDLIAGSMIAALEEPARSQALAFLDQYFTYVDAYDQWQQSFDKDSVMANDPASMRDRLTQLEDLRRQHLGDEAYEAFFAELDQTNSAYLEAQIAMQQPNLTEADKEAIRQQLKEALPPQVREAQEASMALVTLTEKTNQLKTQGASDAELYQARVELVGEEAAKRLAQVDEEKRVWEQKRNQYKSLISATPGLDGMTVDERTAYVADLAQRELGLSSNEIKRMQALDRIEAAESVQ